MESRRADIKAVSAPKPMCNRTLVVNATDFISTVFDVYSFSYPLFCCRNLCVFVFVFDVTINDCMLFSFLKRFGRKELFRKTCF